MKLTQYRPGYGARKMVANNPYCIDIQEWSTKCHYLINLFANSVSSVYMYTTYEEAQTKFSELLRNKLADIVQRKVRQFAPERRCYSGTVHITNKKHRLQLVSSLTTVFDHLSKNNRKLSLILYSIDVRVSSPPFQGSPFLHATEYIKEGQFKH